MAAKIDEVESLIQQHEEVLHIFSTVGAARGGEVNEATVNVMLKAKESRSVSQAILMQQVREELRVVPGLQAYVAMFPYLSGMSEAPLQVYVTGPDLYELARLSQLLLRQLEEHGDMGDIRMDLQLDRPMLRLILTAIAPGRWVSAPAP